MNLQQLKQAIYNKSYITGEFLLRSGKISNEYFDKYQFESDPVILKAIAEHLAMKIKVDYDYLGALEMGGIPIATMLSQITQKQIVLVRKEAKKYGTAKLAEGPDFKEKTILLVEDVVTSGGQIIESTEELRKLGANIENALCVIDRQSGGAENLKEKGINLTPLFTMSELKSSI